VPEQQQGQQHHQPHQNYTGVPEPVSSSQPGHTGSMPPPQQNQYQAGAFKFDFTTFGGVGQQEGHHFQQQEDQYNPYDMGDNIKFPKVPEPPIFEGPQFPQDDDL